MTRNCNTGKNVHKPIMNVNMESQTKIKQITHNQVIKRNIHTYPSNVCEKYLSVFAISDPDATGKMPFTIRE